VASISKQDAADHPMRKHQDAKTREYALMKNTKLQASELQEHEFGFPCASDCVFMERIVQI
jgi:hypothetical protein